MNKKIIASTLLISIISMNGCNYNPETIAKANYIKRSATSSTNEDSDGYTSPTNSPFEKINTEQTTASAKTIKYREFNIETKEAIKVTLLPLALDNYTHCNSDHDIIFCENRFPTYDIKNLPANLKEDYTGIKYIDTMFKLPNIKDIEVYILARNMTDIEEYTIVTYDKKIIDKLLIGKIGSADNSDRRFSISKNYKNIEINFNDKTKNYKVNNLGNILGI